MTEIFQDHFDQSLAPDLEKPEPSKPSTARKGNPSQASRGAAVRRAKAKLGDTLDKVLEPKIDDLYYSALSVVIGCSASEVPSKLSVASLSELEAWTEAVSSIGANELKQH